MDLLKAISERRSIRSYKSLAIDNDTVKKLKDFITECNLESGLNIQLVTNEPKAFESSVFNSVL